MNKTLFEFSSIEELEKSIFEKYNSDEEFKKEREKIYYKAFKPSEIFNRTSLTKLKTPIKDLDVSDEQTEEYCIPNITMSNLNEGIGGYLKDEGEISEKKASGYISIVSGINAGVSFYHDYSFVATGADTLVVKNDNIKKELDSNKKAYKLIALELKQVFQTKQHGWESGAKSAKDGRARGITFDFNRELILLPVYQDENNQEHISVKTLSYLYDRIKFNEYKQKIEKLERERDIQLNLLLNFMKII